MTIKEATKKLVSLVDTKMGNPYVYASYDRRKCGLRALCSIPCFKLLYAEAPDAGYRGGLFLNRFGEPQLWVLGLGERNYPVIEPLAEWRTPAHRNGWEYNVWYWDAGPHVVSDWIRDHGLI